MQFSIIVMKFFERLLTGTSVRVLFRSVSTSVVAATGTCLCLKQYKEDTGLLKKHGKYSAVTGLVLGIPAGIVAARINHVIIPATLITQTLGAAAYAFSFLSVRSGLSNLDLTYPNSKPVGDLLLTSASSGASLALMSYFRGRPMLRGFRDGIFFGVVVHAVYLYISELKTLYLLRNEYPELVQQMIDAEKYMSNESESNINYRGPVAEKNFFVEWCDSKMSELKHIKEKGMKNSLEELSKRSDR